MRALFVWLHRYVGLAPAGFLLIEGLTGAQRPSLAALALRAEAPEPTEHVAERDDADVWTKQPRDRLRPGGGLLA